MQNTTSDSFGLGPAAGNLSYPAKQMLRAQYSGKMWNGQLYNDPAWINWGADMRRRGMIDHPSLGVPRVRQGPTIDDLILRIPAGQTADSYSPQRDYDIQQVLPNGQPDPMAAHVEYASYKRQAAPAYFRNQSSQAGAADAEVEAVAHAGSAQAESGGN